MTNLKKSYLAVACAALLVVTLNSAAQEAERRIPTNLQGVTAAPEPPQGFDPISASDRELDDYGFPPRPDSLNQPEFYAKWVRVIGASKQRIVPELKLTEKFHGPAQRVTKDNGSASTYNWSGAVQTTGATAYGASSAYFAMAEYVIPTANQAFGTCNGGWDYSSTWTGLDGYGGKDVLQAGTESDALCIYYLLGHYDAWIEWFPLPEMQIANLPVNAGDDIVVEVWSTSATQGHVYMANLNSNQNVSLAITAPSGTRLVGNSAEWVVERPTVNGKMATLTNYVTDYLSGCIGLTSNGQALYPGSPSATLLTMLDNNSQPISDPTLLGPYALWMTDTGSARY